MTRSLSSATARSSLSSGMECMALASTMMIFITNIWRVLQSRNLHQLRRGLRPGRTRYSPTEQCSAASITFTRAMVRVNVCTATSPLAASLRPLKRPTFMRQITMEMRWDPSKIPHRGGTLYKLARHSRHCAVR